MFDLAISGLLLGCLISMSAVGLTLLARIHGFFNVAHGILFTLGAYLSLRFLNLLPDWGTFPTFSFGPALILAMFLSMLATGAVALISYVLYYKPLLNRGLTPPFLTLSSLGLMFILRSVVYLSWGSRVRYYSWNVPTRIPLPFGLGLLSDDLFIIAFAIVLLIGVQIFLRRTGLGKRLRATTEAKTLASVSGIKFRNMVSLTWILAGVLSAAAGTLYGITVHVKPLMGWDFLLALFAAIVIGGVGSLRGAIAGAIIVGFVQEVGAGFLQNLFFSMGIRVQMYSYKLAIVFTVVILVLLTRPEGLRTVFWGRSDR
ncbi:MAG: branched-chain amino acid ABC transporter permease [Candidatus Acetothermia bacterium]